MKKAMAFCMAAVLSIGTAVSASAAPLSIQAIVKGSCEASSILCDPKSLRETLKERLEQCFPNLTFPETPATPSVPTKPIVPSVPSAPSKPDVPDVPDAPETETPETDKPEAPEADSTAAAYAARVIELVNEERAKEGLSALKSDEKAAAAAQVRAEEILVSFSHTRPDGRECFTALDEAGAAYRAAGENIAMGQRTPEEVVEDWMHSKGHRENILGGEYKAIGVGYFEGGWVQLFIG